MTPHEIACEHGISIIYNVYCGRCKKEYPSSDLILTQRVSYPTLTLMCPTEGCRGEITQSIYVIPEEL